MTPFTAVFKYIYRRVFASPDSRVLGGSTVIQYNNVTFNKLHVERVTTFYKREALQKEQPGRQTGKDC